jgi:hypothetical protein
LLVIAALGLLISGCSAPHENPLDPKSTHHRLPDSPADELDLTVRVASLHRVRGSFETWSVLPQANGPDAALVDSCWVTYDSRPRVPMNETADEIWSYNFAANSGNLGTFIGQPFVFAVRDSATQVTHTFGPAFLFRWLETPPTIVQPDSDQVTGPHPELRWEPYAATFSIDYSAFMVADTGAADTVWRTNLPAGVSMITIPDSLPDGSYVWTLVVADTFRNSCSIEAQFSVRH